MNTSMSYEDVKANVTWYLLNSYGMDPTYQYMRVLQQDMLKKMQPPKTNFTTYDPVYSVYVDSSPILRYGTYSCSAPGKEAYVDSLFSCFLFQLPFFLEKIEVGYLGYALVIPIILISLFGGIKESFRWFILNQAIWDLFVCYDFICSKPTVLGWFGSTYQSTTTCFYYTETYADPWIKSLGQSFRVYLKNGWFIPIFLIAFSRFLAMYFSKFYRNFTKNNYKMIASLFIYNLFFIVLFCFHRIWINFFYTADLVKGFNDCAAQFCLPPLNRTYCMQYVAEYFHCANRLSMAVSAQYEFLNHPLMLNLLNFTSPIMFLLSNLCIALLFYKIASQLKFQLKTNRDSFIQTIKISSVVAFQCFITSIIFLITVVQKYLETVRSVSNDGRIYYSVPPWLFFLQYSTTTTSLNMIRVFLDSFVVLIILNAYSSCLLKTFKFFILCFVYPKQAYKIAKAKFFNNRSTVVTIISTSTKARRN